MATATVAAEAVPDRGEAPRGVGRRRRADPRQARAAVLAGLGAFAVLMGGAALLIETRLPGVIDPVYYGRLRYVRDGQAADPARARTVVLLGTSRSYEGVNAAALSRQLYVDLGRPVVAVNWGVPGGGFLTDLLTWRRLRRDGVRPDLLLIELMPSLFNADGPGGMNEVLLPASRLDAFDLRVLEPYRAGTRPGLWREVALDEAATLYSRRYALTWAVAPHLVPTYDDSGAPYVWLTNPSFHQWQPSAEMRAKAVERAYREYGRCLADFQPARCEALRELLASSREAGVPTALLIMPEGPLYRSWYGRDTWPTIQAWVEGVRAEFGVEVFNAREWIDEENEFRDSHHLLPSGAAAFSERLGREYVLPTLRRLP